MIVGGSCQKIFITSIPLNQTDKVNPYNGMRFQCMFISVIVYSYSHLKFSNQHLVLLDIRTEENVLEKDAPVISGLPVSTAWWLYNL